MKVANTETPAAGRPTLFPPAKINPFPLTVMLPLGCTVATRLLIVQIWPGGWTPRTILKLTVGEADDAGVFVSSGSVTQGAGAEGVPGQPVTLEMGSTPIPPLNCHGLSAAAGSDQTAPSNIVHANAFFMTPPFTRLQTGIPVHQESTVFGRI